MPGYVDGECMRTGVATKQLIFRRLHYLIDTPPELGLRDILHSTDALDLEVQVSPIRFTIMWS